MKKLNLILIGLFTVGSVGALNAQISCDETPDPGQTVGKCISGSSEEGEYAACGVYYEGPICYFGEPVVGG
jgi:hypothetical protein